MEKQLQETHTGAAGGAERPDTGAEEKTPGHQPPRPESRVSRGSARRAASQVSCGSAVSRVSAEAQLTARLKNLRLRQLERKLDMERQEEQERHELKRELKRQEDEENELKRVSNELKRQRELRALRDEAEEAELEARLRLQLEDDLSADRRYDFVGEDVCEHEPELEKGGHRMTETRMGNDRGGDTQRKQRTGNDAKTTLLPRLPGLTAHSTLSRAERRGLTNCQQLGQCRKWGR